MKVIKVENQVEGGKVAFEILREKLANGAQTLGLATGSSPLEFYKKIVESDLSHRTPWRASSTWETTSPGEGSYIY